MRERPILMSGPLVRAVLEGRKSQTRRPVKLLGAEVIAERDDGTLWPWSPQHDGWIACPHGQVGERLWVRESLQRGQMRSLFTDELLDVPAALYAVDGEPVLCPLGFDTGPWWSSPGGLPSIHMPRWASRLTLRITDVRVERLQSISEEDTIAEGVERVGDRWRDYMPEREAPRQTYRTARESFLSLWESIYGAESLAANPWLWALTFEREVTP